MAGTMVALVKPMGECMGNINMMKVNIVLAFSFLALVITSQVISHIKSMPVVAITEEPLLIKGKKKVMITNKQKRIVAAKFTQNSDKITIQKRQ